MKQISISLTNLEESSKDSEAPSSAKVHLPSFLELGLGKLVLICSNLCEMGTPPAVFDADQLQLDPKVLFLWEVGPIPDGVWAPWWYKSVHESIGFSSPKKYPRVKEAIFRSLITNGMFDNTHIRLSLTRGKK
ncbi:unnamed protein product [Arabidopsis halleri]